MVFLYITRETQLVEYEYDNENDNFFTPFPYGDSPLKRESAESAAGLPRTMLFFSHRIHRLTQKTHCFARVGHPDGSTSAARAKSVDSVLSV